MHEWGEIIVLLGATILVLQSYRRLSQSIQQNAKTLHDEVILALSGIETQLHFLPSAFLPNRDNGEVEIHLMNRDLTQCHGKLNIHRKLKTPTFQHDGRRYHLTKYDADHIAWIYQELV